MGTKIGNIAKQSGIPATTIRYYVKEGLLPSPVKINKKMGHYDESCVERIQAIQKLQEKRFPLGVIKNILSRMDEGVSLDEAAALEDIVFGPTDSTTPKLIGRDEYLVRTGLTSAEVAAIEKTGLLMPFSSEEGKNLYDQEDVLMGRSVFKRILDLGIIPEDMDFYVTLGLQIVENEMTLRKRVTQKIAATTQENLKISADLTNIAHLSRGYVLRRLFQRRVLELINKKHESRKKSKQKKGENIR
jgi:DNA-binding transcriptional MerR regulator